MLDITRTDLAYSTLFMSICIIATLLIVNYTPDVEMIYSVSEDRCLDVIVNGEYKDCSYVGENTTYIKTYVR